MNDTFLRQLEISLKAKKSLVPIPSRWRESEWYLSPSTGNQPESYKITCTKSIKMKRKWMIPFSVNRKSAWKLQNHLYQIHQDEEKVNDTFLRQQLEITLKAIKSLVPIPSRWKEREWYLSPSTGNQPESHKVTCTKSIMMKRKWMIPFSVNWKSAWKLDSDLYLYLKLKDRKWLVPPPFRKI